MSQEHKQPQKSKQTEETTQDIEVTDLQNEELGEETDDLLDEIDSVLEKNSQEFVSAFIQQGGQ